MRWPNISESFKLCDLNFTGFKLDTAQSYIASFEALAHCAAALFAGGRLCVRIKSWCDNSGAESASNRLYTGKYPLNIFVQRLSLFSCFSGIRLDVGHIPVDLLLRWDGQAASFPV